MLIDRYRHALIINCSNYFEFLDSIFELGGGGGAAVHLVFASLPWQVPFLLLKEHYHVFLKPNFSTN